MIEIAPRGPREGEVLQLPNDFTPVPDLTLDTLERDKHTRALLEEEDAWLRSLGMSWEEMQRYKAKLTDGVAAPQAPGKIP